MRKTIFMMTLVLLFATLAAAQDDDDTGLWGELVFTKTINKRVDWITGARYETKANNSETQEWRVYSGFNIKFGKTNKWSVQPQYTYTQAGNRAGRYNFEHRPTVIVNRRFQKKGSKWSFNIGARNEFRIRPGKNDVRIVPLSGIQYALNKKTSLFSRQELWLDSRKADPTQRRVRIFVGFTRVINDNLSIEPFFLVQKDVKFSPHWVVKGGFFLRIKS